MKIRVEGYRPTLDCYTHKPHSDYDQYHVFDSLRYGPIHEENDLSREELIREFIRLFPQFYKEDCRIIRVGEERKID